VGITLLMEKLGVSPALGAFIAGVMLANSEYRHTVDSDLQPFKGLLLGLFFISVGMGMDFSFLLNEPFHVIGVVMGFMLVKMLLLYGLARIFNFDIRQGSGLAVVLAQGGEFAFVLFQYAHGFSIFTNDETKFLTLCVALSMALTPFFVMIYSRWIIPQFMSLLSKRAYDVIDEKNGVILAGFNRFGQIVGRFLMAQSVPITIIEKDPDQIELLRKFGYKGYFGDSTREALMRSAGAETAKLLIIAVDNPKTCLEIVRLAKRAFPHLAIYARAHDRQHCYQLHKLGVTYFKREMFDSALTLAKEAMVFLGHRESDMHYKAEQFRQHDEATLKKSFAFYEDEQELIHFARASRKELEDLLRRDVMDKPDNTDK
jgi:voltage-gated potassium channel Kch